MPKALDVLQISRRPRPIRGMPASCAGCGACCEDAGYPPHTPAELKRLRIVDLRAAVTVEAERRKPSGENRAALSLPCIWLDPAAEADGKAGLCIWPDLRPAECTGFTIGGELCLLARAEDVGPAHIPRVTRRGGLDGDV